MLGTDRSTGVISYAGMDADALLEDAKHAFALTDEAIPARFSDFLPLFPAELIVQMSYRGNGQFSCDPAEYHQKLYEEQPQLYTGANAQRAFDAKGRFRRGAVVTVDAVWAERFPQYRPFLGEKLMLHCIGGGCQAAAVPYSIFPYGGGVLEKAERDLHITQRCTHYARWLAARLDDGQPHEQAQMEQAYLTEFGLNSVWISQRDLNRAQREVQVMRSLKTGEDASLAAASSTLPPQYVPYRYACDVFEPVPVTRRTARLMQLYFRGEKIPGDFWLPYEDASQYMHKRRGTLDVRALCEGFQIAPACDADTRGGCYPDCVRVVVVRDRSLPLWAAETCSNPAYGSGLNAQGAPNQLVWLPDSHELLRQKRLSEEPFPVNCIHTRVEEEACLHMRTAAERQEYQGRLIDAMRRREEALGQLQPGTITYDHAREMLDARVSRLEKRIQALQPAEYPGSYDEDIAYLQRMAQHREEQADTPFQPDMLRERSIQNGETMRAGVQSFALYDLCDRPEPVERPRTAARPEQAADSPWFEQIYMFADASAQTTKEEIPHEPDAP